MRLLLLSSLLAGLALGLSTTPAAAEEARPEPGAAPGVEARIAAILGRPGGLTADRAATQARSTSAVARKAWAEAGAAHAEVDHAGLDFAPRVSARASYMRLSNVGMQSLGAFVAAPTTAVGAPVAAGTSLVSAPLAFGFPNDNYALGVDVVVPVSDYVLRLANRYASAKRSARAADLAARAAELASATRARQLYYGWVRAEVEGVIAAETLELARHHREDAGARLAAGQASAADTLQAEALLADRELLVARAAHGVAAALDELRTALHDPPGARYTIGEDLFADLPPLPAEDDLEALVREAHEARLELLAVRESEAAYRAQASAARVGLLPRLDAVGNATYANPNGRYFPPPSVWNGTWAVGAALSWSSNDAVLGGTGGSAAGKKADATAAEEDALREGVRAEVVHAYQAVHDATTAIGATRRGLAAAEESFRVRRALFRVGQATSTELTDAENALARARFAAVSARVDLRISRAALTHATGRDAAR